MTREELEDALDEAKDQLVDLRIDLKELASSYEEEQREMKRLQEELDRVELESGKTSETLDSITSKYEEELQAYRDEQRTFSTTIHKLKEEYHHKYLKALSIAETIDKGNVDYFRTAQGKDFIFWARKEFQRQAAHSNP